MKKLIIASIILLAVSNSAALFAVDWASKKAVLKNEETDDTEKILTVTGDNGKDFILKYTGDLSDKHADSVLSLNKSFYTWKFLKVKNITFTITNDLIEVNVIPETFIYKKQNLVPHLPSGMLFSYGDYLVYNFRVSKNNYFVRINNKLSTEDALCDNITEVLANPLEYLRKREPDFLFRKITQIEEENIQIKNELKSIKELIKSNADVQAAQNEKYDKLLYGVLGIHNTGFLGFGNDPIDRKGIARVVELKKKNPALKKKDIENILEKEKIKLSNQEIELILNIYFNEFD